MTDQELLQAIRAITREEMKPLKEEMEEMKESLTEVRTGVNMLIDWSEKVSMAAKFPLPNIDD